MTLYTLTTSPEAFSMRVQSNDQRNISQAGVLQSANRTGNRWMLNMRWRLPGAEYRTLRGEIGKLQGTRHRLYVPFATKMGYLRGSTVSLGGALTMNGAHTAGTTTIAFKSLPADTANIIIPGDLMQIGDFGQLTQCVTALTSVGTTGSCTIWPELHKNRSDGDGIGVLDPGGVFILMSDFEIGSEAFGQDWFGEMSVEMMQDVTA